MIPDLTVLTMRRALGVLLFLFVIVAAIGSGSWLTPTCEGVSTENSPNKIKNAIEACPSLDAVIFFKGTNAILSINDFIHIHRDDLNAYSTIVIAVFTAILGAFTIRLARSTRVAAEAAQKSAEALPAIERAYIFVTGELEYWDPINTSDERTVYSSRIGVKFHLENHGKTPAIIGSIEAHLRVWSIDPDNTQHFPSIFLPNEIIIRSGDTWTPPNSPLNFQVDELTADAIANQTATIWFYGSIIYQDVFGNDRVTRFRWARSEILEIFGPRGGRPYNERT
jgi:hypothetical protein